MKNPRGMVSTRFLYAGDQSAQPMSLQCWQELSERSVQILFPTVGQGEAGACTKKHNHHEMVVFWVTYRPK